MRRCTNNGSLGGYTNQGSHCTKSAAVIPYLYYDLGKYCWMAYAVDIKESIELGRHRGKHSLKTAMDLQKIGCFVHCRKIHRQRGQNQGPKPLGTELGRGRGQGTSHRFCPLWSVIPSHIPSFVDPSDPDIWPIAGGAVRDLKQGK